MTKYNSYQLKPLKMLVENNVKIQGANILEVGGGAHLTCPKEFIELGAESVLVTNIAHGLVEKQEGKITTKLHSALEIDGLDETFDIIYGVAVLEHIPDPQLLFQQVYRCLNQGGYAFFSGGPIWSSALGHHCWITLGDIDYHFTDRNLTNLLEPFDHVLNDEESLSIKLSKNIGSENAKLLAHHIYNDPHINRESHGSILSAINATPLSIMSYQSRLFSNERYTSRLDHVRNRYMDLTDPAVMGFDILLQKVM